MAEPASGRDDRARRGRSSLLERAQRRLEIYPWLDQQRGFRPVLLLCIATAVGLLLTPDLAPHDYPTDPGLEGTPASENVKAPYDLEVIDEATTARLREEAVARVRRIYDFDALLAQKGEERVEHAFRTIRGRLDAAGAAPRPPPGDDASAYRGEFEQALGVPLRHEEFAALLATRFDANAEAGLRRLLHAGLAVPIAASRATLEADRSRGIVLQRVPTDGQPPQVVEAVDTIIDLESARLELIGRAAQLLPALPPALRGSLATLAARLLEPTVSLNRADTEMQRADERLSVKPQSVAVKKGEMVIRDGERLTARHLLIFDVLRRQGHGSSFLLVAGGGALLLMVLVACATRFAHGARRRLELRARDHLLLASTFLCCLAVARFWLVVSHLLHENYPSVPLDTFIFLAPTAASAMVVRLVLRADVALLFALVTSLMLGLLADSDRMLSLYALVGFIAAVSSIRTISARSDLLRAGLVVGLVQAACALGIQLFGANTGWQSYAMALPAAFVGGAVAGFVALSLTPLVEWAFHYTTDLQLLELSNLNHPALKELIVQAPGSYHHSIIVGALVEAAAESINANPLLARVMAYYHDLGKGCNPGYFVENQRTGHNPHDKIKPSMSAMVIRRHVTDGLELARRHGLGEQILAGIAQHHGTTLIQFFYHKAREQAEDPDSVSEAEYRYPGQKPQSREAALVMLGDSLEAASRSMPDPTSARLAGLVSRIINHKFTDGQLDECDLTLRDLHTIAKSFTRVLNSIYHHRLEYPEAAPSGGRRPPDGGEPPHGGAPEHLRRLGL